MDYLVISSSSPESVNNSNSGKIRHYYMIPYHFVNFKKTKVIVKFGINPKNPGGKMDVRY
jgi:hypothetical protein